MYTVLETCDSKISLHTTQKQICYKTIFLNFLYLFKASEKALKAAQFSVDAVTSFNHDLSMLAAHIEDMELRRLALKLQGIVGDSNRLYNPDPIDFVVIPHEEFNKDTACDAVMCATDILERAKEFLDCQ